MCVKIQCDKCGQCCKGSMGPFVFPSDVCSISNELGIDKKSFLDRYCRIDVIDINHEKIKIYSIKNINGACTFLSEDNLCKIYSYRPYQCVNAPYEFLSNYGLWSHMKCLNKEMLNQSDSSFKDYLVFKEIIEIGYENL